MKLPRLHRMQPACCHSIGYVLRLATAALFAVISANEYAHSSSFNFRIQDYKPDTVIAKQWVLDASWRANGVRASRERTLSYWDMVYEDEQRIVSRDNQVISINSTWRRLRRTLNREISTFYAVYYEYFNLGGLADSTECHNCRGTGSNAISIRDPKSYIHNLVLQSHTSYWQMIANPVGLFASISLRLQGEEKWENGRIIQNTYDMDGTFHHWKLSERLYANRDRSYGADLGIQTGVTIGQQYEGKYASAVLYLLEGLEKEGYLDHPPSATEIHSLCDTALHYVNAYATDDRRHRSSLLSALTETLERMHLLRGPATQTTFLIDDRWYNMTYYTRPFGFQIRLEQQGQHYHESERGSERDWWHFRDVVTPIDTPNVTRVTEQTSIHSHSDADWTGVSQLVLRTHLQANYGHPLSSRWHWNIRLSAVSGDITIKYPGGNRHKTDDFWWDNASASVTTRLEYHATPRTIYSSGLYGSVSRVRHTLRDGNFGISDGRGHRQDLYLSLECRRWVSPEFAIDMRIYNHASHESIRSVSQVAASWYRSYGIAVGISFRGGY